MGFGRLAQLGIEETATLCRVFLFKILQRFIEQGRIRCVKCGTGFAVEECLAACRSLSRNRWWVTPV